MCGATFYRALPYFYAFICILEFISAIVVLFALTGNWPSSDGNTVTTTPGTSTATTTVSLVGMTKLLIAVYLAFIGSIVPVFTGLIVLLSMFVCCICVVKKNWRRPFLRFVVLNCTCPCYIPRPKLRFTVRIGFHIICIALRIAGVIMYGLIMTESLTSSDRTVLQALLIITAASLIFPFLTIILDIYHYRVWWAYKPDVDISPDIAKKPLSHKHKRYIPYVLTERFRTTAFGNRKCKYGNRCQGRELEHVVMFHSTEYKPQPRWSNKYPIYIGFHRTTPQAAVSIAKSEFRGSLKGMLGPGAYFARSTDATLSKIGKADQIGAWFVAKISMGKVFEVDEDSIRSRSNNNVEPVLQPFVQNGEWHAEYDTCYFKHHIESKDEFCIKDPEKQILKWVVVIEPPHDRKISAYGLDTELNSGPCGFC
ncbi:unnamed protein product [Rotaria sp. Silwood2]|nr:unnamed protein product [Rotaria sp. Silwood2]CAF3155804.1 unnamed protein product [Rotaria sp. Silwood2]CAF3300333.1 unnamed protein product [Rotaria sp. Silwood2]CAF4495902.1 unnamed protein product [Rotaria sp. Silwood2]CAF4522081.1 unnamed protein product [Rotaria sp. Silwood2]